MPTDNLGVRPWHRHERREELRKGCYSTTNVSGCLMSLHAQVLQELVEALFPAQDSASSIQRLYIGQSGHQKLDLLNELVMFLGYEGLAGEAALPP